MSVLVLVSQPLSGLPSQSAKPGLHRTSRHAPSEQSLVALARLQLRPHAPQFIVLLRVFTSHPSLVMRLQSAKPGRHIPIPHAPIAQPGVLLGSIPHTREQPPQLLTSLLVLTSQPLASLLSQFSKLGEHRPTLHIPATHAATPLAMVHIAPQRPQLSTVVRRSTSHPSAAFMLQSAKPSLHRKPHIPLAHVAVALGGAGHGLPQRPQLLALALVSVSQPLAALLSQSPKLPEQRPTAHRPIEHDGSALGTMHAIPQPPQLAELDCVSMHASVQHVCPIGHGCAAEQPITQRFPRQTCPDGQCESITHGTHVCDTVLQRGVSPEQPSSREQPGAHCPDRRSQY
jgi:hypothetical protein